MPPAKDVEEAAAPWRPPPFEPPIEAIKAEQKAPLILSGHFARTSVETATSSGGDGGSTDSGGSDGGSDAEVPEAARRGWGRRYTRREMEEATAGLAAANVMGQGGYGVVYKGVLRDGTAVAIKNLHNNRGQAEKDFRKEVQTIGRVRHKNLVSLLGYCSEGACSNLDKWLHHDDSEVSPLTWDIRMRILLGTAKGLAYLHEGLEPKIVHRDIKSSDILLDRQWNAKVSDFGLAKLLRSERSFVTTRVLGTFGYVAPEYAKTGMLNERSDVYSFGVLVMEAITGRTPVDYTRPADEGRSCGPGMRNCGSLAVPSGEPGGVAEAHGRGAEGGGGAGPPAAGAGAAAQGPEAGGPRRAPVRRPGGRPEARDGARGPHARRRPDATRRVQARPGPVPSGVG
ncbi:hypothetical protein PVAP13_9NG490200 [Panicum virgatum]|uniref:non-specific serine/threonine protein kinase n=1 Tax=Panicum virgatum TaxID=38727 RepID=A0A8T0MXJ7_PANVG|nr:hypothetical protein PVAP13_9NG490200 [Panicum virgatum]